MEISIQEVAAINLEKDLLIIRLKALVDSQKNEIDRLNAERESEKEVPKKGK